MIVIFNPSAGQRRSRLLWAVLDIMASRGIRLEVTETRCAGHAVTLAREAAAAGVTLVVAAGGDGTIAEVANGLAGTACRLGIIPIGTANVLAHELGLEFGPYEIAGALAFGRSCTIWPGIAHSGSSDTVFVQMLGIGFEAQVVHRLQLPLKRALGRSAYVLQAGRELPRYRFPEICLRLDNTVTTTRSAIVTKGRFYAGRHLLSPTQRMGERGFSVVMFDWGGAAATLLYGASLPLNLISQMPGVRLLHADVIEILSEGAPMQVDGDPLAHPAMRITEAAMPMRVVVSQRG